MLTSSEKEAFAEGLSPYAIAQIIDPNDLTKGSMNDAIQFSFFEVPRPLHKGELVTYTSGTSHFEISRTDAVTALYRHFTEDHGIWTEQ